MRSLYPSLIVCVMAFAQDVQPLDPIKGLIGAFDRQQIVMLGELHENRQQHEGQLGSRDN
jgi:hypothetical protein